MTDIGASDALLIVDVQVDFCPAGALAVSGSDRVVPVVSAWIERFSRAATPVFASRDSHPVARCSFKEQGEPRLPHCVRDTPGAVFHPRPALPDGIAVISKGTAPDRDAHCALDGTDVAGSFRGLRRSACS